MAGRCDSQSNYVNRLKQYSCAALSCVTFLFSAPVFAADSPEANKEQAVAPKKVDMPPFVAEYTVTTNALPITGTGTRSLKSLGNGKFRLEQVAKSFILTLREISEFKMDHCAIIPGSYRYEQSGIGRDRRHLVDFNHNASSAIYEENKTKSVIEIPEDERYYDRLSETLALQCKLLERRSEGTTSGEGMEEPIILNVVDKGSLRTHEFEIKGTETIKVAQTEMKTLRLERVRGNENRQTIMWFAPGQNFALAKLQQINKGKSLMFELKSIKQDF